MKVIKPVKTDDCKRRPDDTWRRSLDRVPLGMAVCGFPKLWLVRCSGGAQRDRNGTAIEALPS